MTTSIVTPPTDTREAKLGLLAVNAQLILFWGEHTLPAPQSLYINAHAIGLRFSSREALDRWFATLGPIWGGEAVLTQPYRHNGRDETLHNATCKRWGWIINLDAVTQATDEPEHTLTSAEREALARATEAGQTLYDATVEDAMAPTPATLGCPRCSHTEYASEEDPDAGLGQMHNHILWEHADRNADVALKLLAEVAVTAVEDAPAARTPEMDDFWIDGEGLRGQSCTCGRRFERFRSGADLDAAFAAHECAPVPDAEQVLAALADKAAEAGAE